ncbi:unnamed protein product [Durusdinium trenchii]|uniref:Disease resistance R13L4/SHOC-2-like LRR domain-containing protein n=1 Tax=Durusdinium trenchii TaxID=1381693 RepID=A0ABP0IHZ5_9DINO
MRLTCPTISILLILTNFTKACLSHNASDETVLLKVLVGFGFKKSLGCLESWVRCNDQGQAVFLDLTRRVRRRDDLDDGQFVHIPKELGELQALEWLYLDQNRLAGTIPPELGMLQSLKSLDLTENNLEGHLPEELGQLENLTWLSLSLNRFSGKIPESFGNLWNLEVLDLRRNAFSGEVPKSLGRLSQLERLRLNHNHLEGRIPQELGQLKNLKELLLQQNCFNGELPAELGNLQALQTLMISENQLQGQIPKELGQMAVLKYLILSQNQLSGNIPRELGHLSKLKRLNLYGNNLTGKIPPELGHPPEFYWLFLDRNNLQGEIPPELGRLKSLQRLSLGKNQLSGQIPTSLSHLKQLKWLNLCQNQLTGTIPEELGNMRNLRWLHLDGNHLSGSIPKALEDLVWLTALDLSHNRFTRISVNFTKLLHLQTLDLSRNLLSGELPAMQPGTEQVDLSRNNFIGNLTWTEAFCTKGEAKQRKRENVADGEKGRRRGKKRATKNRRFRKRKRRKKSAEAAREKRTGLQGLRLNHNSFTGKIPACLMQLNSLKHLSLNNNRLHGRIPAINATQLVVLALHRNDLSGAVPESLQNLSHLAVLTLHENSLDGAIGPLKLTSPCIDNDKMNVRGFGCSVLRLILRPRQSPGNETDCSPLQASPSASQDEAQSQKLLSAEEMELVKRNCPDLCKTCQNGEPAKATFHHNRFSCELPESISEGVATYATVVMGNMVGHGQRLNVSWISAEENFAFLYYSPRIWSAQVTVISSILAMALGAVVFHQQFRSFWKSSQRMLQSTPATPGPRVVASNLVLLKVASCNSCHTGKRSNGLHPQSDGLQPIGNRVRVNLRAHLRVGTVLLACPLLLVCLLGTGYYTCAPPLSQITVANLKDNDHRIDLAVLLLWSAMLFLFRSIPASMPKCCRLQTDIANILSVRAVLVRVAAWFVWVCIVILLSLPSILFAVAQAVPANAAGLNEKVLSWIHRAAPYLIVLIELLLAHPLSTKYSARSGIEADRLLMTFRLSSAWFMSLLATAFLHENCFAGWKLFWVVCQESSAEHEAFNWKLWSQEILFAKKDMCRLGERWWVDGRCTRSIVDGLTPLLLKKLLVRSVVVPLVLLPLWYSSRLDTSCAPLNAQKGRHLRLLGGLKVTGSLVPLRQTALLTTFMEVLFFWSPLIPLLSLCILSATAANFFLFDVGIRSFNVQVPLDAMNQSATLSRCESGFSPECLIKGFF